MPASKFRRHSLSLHSIPLGVYSSNMQHDFNQEAIALHKEKRGKLGVVSKVPLATRED